MHDHDAVGSNPGSGRRNRFPAVLAALAVALAAGCTATPDDAGPAAATAGDLEPAASGDPAATADPVDSGDPVEIANRMVFALNEAVDTLVITPIIVTYRDWFPAPLQRNVTNVVREISLVPTFVQSVLQGDLDRAGDAAGRFATNLLTLGLGDPATQLGQEPHFTEDFGQTLAAWGFQSDSGESPYLVLPVIGPSNMRDAFGLAGGALLDPLTLAAGGSTTFGLARFGTTGFDARARNADTIDDLRASSLDYYAAVRSLYRQRRDAEIRNGEAPADYDFLSIDFGPADDGSRPDAGN